MSPARRYGMAGKIEEDRTMADGKTRSTGGVDWKSMASGRMKPMIAVMCAIVPLI